MKTTQGLWKLSPSGLYTYEDCPSCFWIEQHVGRHPFTLPLRLNDAMDERLKIRYDSYRRKGALPPEISDAEGIKLFSNQDTLDEWRNNRTALAFINNDDGYLFEGKIDEVFVTDEDELMPADYKSSGDEPKEDKQKYYKLQLHAYSLMLREQGYKVANRAYLIHYFTKNRQDPSLNMEFICHLDEVKISLDAFENKMREMVEFLNSDYPGANQMCSRCLWLEKRSKMV